MPRYMDKTLNDGYNIGRKEVAREIFDELDKVVREHKEGFCCDWYLYERYTELKKKYTEDRT